MNRPKSKLLPAKLQRAIVSVARQALGLNMLTVVTLLEPGQDDEQPRAHIFCNALENEAELLRFCAEALNGQADQMSTNEEAADD